MTNIAFTGKMRAGKDTAADHLRNQFGGKNLKFADPLYEMQREIYRIANLSHPVGTRDRLLLQFLGTEWGRKTIDQNIWINVMAHTLETEPKDQNLFITDCRFVNEFNLLKSKGFVLVRIKRPLEDRIRAGAINLEHESETSLDEVPDSCYDYVLENDGSLQDYYAKVESMFQVLNVTSGDRNS